jgi:hypothetical protein
MAANTNFDALSASTQRYYTQDKFEDCVFEGVPILKYLKSRKGVHRDWDGGEKIVIPTMEGTNSTVQWQSGYSEIDTTPQDGFGAAEFQPKLITGTVVMFDVDQWKNSGPSAVIKLWKGKVDQCVEEMQTQFEAALFSDGTSDPHKIVGLPLAIDSAGTYGNISRTNNTFWQSYEEGTAGVLAEPDMSTAIRTASRNKAKFSDYVWVTTLALFQKMESLILPAYRVTDTRMADLGIPSLQYMGAPMIWSDDCTSQVMYLVHMPSFELHAKSGQAFNWGPKFRPNKQLADAMPNVWYGALTNKNPRFSGKLTGRTAA